MTTYLTVRLLERANRRTGRDPNGHRLTDLSDAVRLGACALGGCLLGDLVGVAGLSLFFDASFLSSWFTRVVADMTGIVLVVGLAFSRPPLHAPHRWEVGAQAVLLAAVTIGSFAPIDHRLSPFVPVCVLVWAGACFGPRLTWVEAFGVATVATLATLAGYGPFTGASLPLSEFQRSLHLVNRIEVYSATLVIVGGTLALAVEQGKRQLVSLADREEQLRRAIDDAVIGMLVLELVEGTAVMTQVNSVAGAVVRADPADLVGGDFLDLVDVGSRREMRATVAEIFTGGTRRSEHQVWMGGTSGPSRLVQITVTALTERDGAVATVCAQLLDVTEAHHAHQRLTELALTDPLTGLANRSALHARLRRALADEAAGPALLLFVDLDDFKAVNDTAGHHTGDEVLVELSARLAEEFCPQHTVARLGGDEFVVLMSEVDDPVAAAASAQHRVTSLLASPVEVDGRSFTVRASIGCALSQAGSTGDGLLAEADAAMYAAKARAKRGPASEGDVDSITVCLVSPARTSVG